MQIQHLNLDSVSNENIFFVRKCWMRPWNYFDSFKTKSCSISPGKKEEITTRRNEKIINITRRYICNYSLNINIILFVFDEFSLSSPRRTKLVSLEFNNQVLQFLLFFFPGKVEIYLRFCTFFLWSARKNNIQYSKCSLCSRRLNPISWPEVDDLLTFQNLIEC